MPHSPVRVHTQFKAVKPVGDRARARGTQILDTLLGTPHTPSYQEALSVAMTDKPVVVVEGVIQQQPQRARHISLG